MALKANIFKLNYIDVHWRSYPYAAIDTFFFSIFLQIFSKYFSEIFIIEEFV